MLILKCSFSRVTTFHVLNYWIGYLTVVIVGLLCLSANAQSINDGREIALLRPSSFATIQPQSSDQAVKYEKVTLDSGALFAHNKAGFDQISADGKFQIYQLAIKLRGIRNVENVTISGHSDNTNSTPIPNYNDKLSLARANAVKNYLSELGLNVSRVTVVGMGDRQPIELNCKAPSGTVITKHGVSKGNANDAEMNAYRACLMPNRRVEIVIYGHPNDNVHSVAEAPLILTTN